MSKSKSATSKAHLAKAAVQQRQNKRKQEAIIFSARGGVFEGGISETFDIPIEKAVFRKNGVSFDWPLDDGDVEGVQMSTQDGINYKGKATKYPGTHDQVVTEVEGVLYANHRGRILVCQCIYADG